MVGRLTLGASRKRGLLALIVPVLLVHGCLAHKVQTLHDSWQGDSMPPRLSVSYVRELKPSLPPPAAQPMLPVPTSPRIRREPASAWQVEALKQTRVDEDHAPAEVAASAPATVASQAVADAADPPAALPLDALPALPAFPVAAASAPNPDQQEPGPEWPPSTRLSYVLTGNYRGAVHGSAQVEWIRQGSHYQVHLDVLVGPDFAPLLSRRMSSDGVLGDRGISPRRYDEDTKVLIGERRRVTVSFQDPEVVLADGSREPAPPGVQDASSQFVQLTWLFLTGREQMRQGLVVELPLALPRRQYRWRYEVLGQQELQTPMGPLATWYLKPSNVASGSDLTAEVWLAPSLQYLPVRIRIRQDAQTFIDLMLKAPAVQAVP